MDLTAFLENNFEEVSFLINEKEDVIMYPFVTNRDMVIIEGMYQKLISNIPQRFRKFFVNMNLDKFIFFLYKLKIKSK